MVLFASDPGALAKLLKRRLKRTSLPVSFSRVDDALFERALGHEVILYLPVPSLLEAALEPRPDPARMRRVLGAANAPGVRRVVVVVPPGNGFAAELELLRRDGKPYIVIESPLLFEEVGKLCAYQRSLWLPRAGSVRATTADALTDAIVNATRSEWDGRVERLEGEPLDVASLFERAAELSNRRCDVYPVWEPVHRLVRPIARFFGPEPQALVIAERLRSLERTTPRAA